MQPESLLLGAGTSMAVTSHWKSNEMLNWSVVTQGNATALGNMEMPANPRSHYGQFSPSTSVFLAVLMTLLVFATVLGNALVILAFVVEKSLRTQGNFFFFNLAIADLLVGECVNVLVNKCIVCHCFKGIHTVVMIHKQLLPIHVFSL